MNMQIVEYSKTAAALATLTEIYAGVIYDVTTTKGMKDAKEGRAELRALRIELEKTRVAIKAPALERNRLIDAEAKAITAQLEALETPIDEQIKLEENKAKEAAMAKAIAERKAVEEAERLVREAEQAKIAAQQAEIDAMRAKQEEMQRQLEAQAKAAALAIEAAERESRMKIERTEREARQAREAEEAKLKAERDAVELAARKLREAEEAKARAAEAEAYEIEKAKQAKADATAREKARKENLRFDARGVLKAFSVAHRGTGEFDEVILAIDNYFHKDA
jgi:colicin import membrane protein